MNDSLLAPVTDSKIKRAIDGLGALKAPGPDGYNRMFFEKHWDIVKEEVCAAIKSFFIYGHLPTIVNEMNVALVPKISLPENIHHLRPISCCNFLPKIISKILVLRMKSMMNHIITQNQSAFIGGRLIEDNLLVAHEVFHALKKKGRGRKDGIAIKLDMSKAYDRLECDFIQKALTAYGFSPIWVDLLLLFPTGIKLMVFLPRSLSPTEELGRGTPYPPTYLFCLPTFSHT